MGIVLKLVFQPFKKKGIGENMGQFSWMFADTNNEEALLEHTKAYVPCPDGMVIFEKCYSGYGEFGGHDIYNLVADWNRDYISEANISKPLREQWGNTEQDEKWFQKALERYKIDCQRINDFVSGKSDEYMKETYGEDWKRNIGIDIACYDEENAALKYPIKICKYRPVSYDILPPSNSDPNQGWGCEEDDYC